ncbi:hypothetical protein AB0K52_04880 [Glycomyces sp. NPDC049804]|uniref:hypothetical protein n=1 Tax=Glycomyces sp. NPDC049804 TaxID=3154363 RepID=UPI00342B8C55
MKRAHNILLEDSTWAKAAASGNASAFIADAIEAEYRRRVDEDTDVVMRHFTESGAGAQWAQFAAGQTGLAPEAFGS